MISKHVNQPVVVEEVLSREEMEAVRGGTYVEIPNAPSASGASAVGLSLSDKLPGSGPTVGGALWSLGLGYLGKALWDYGPEALGVVVDGITWLGSSSNQGSGGYQPLNYY